MSFEFIQNNQDIDFLWIDMEFTGLDIEDDVVLEVGAVATDGLFEVKDEFTAFIMHDAGRLDSLLDRNMWWDQRPEHKKSMHAASVQNGKHLEEVDNDLYSFTQDNKRPGSTLHIAGNSIYNDRKWVGRDFPKLDSLLHYRMLDVSSLKLVVASTLGVSFVKEERHRALEDIYESMDELKALLRILGRK